MKIKPGKYCGAKFTPEQTKARKMWEAAQRREVDMADALITAIDGPHFASRSDFLARCANEWDRWHELRNYAKHLFPKVEESFVIRGMWTSVTP